ncbi:MAG: DUF5659 domain-containing protein [Anaeroplasmataceae bacterium]
MKDKKFNPNYGYKEVMNQNVAKALINQGFEVHRVRDNITEPGKKVYGFKRTPKFITAFLKLIYEFEK